MTELTRESVGLPWIGGWRGDDRSMALWQYRNWFRPKLQAFSWFSSKENHTS